MTETNLTLGVDIGTTGCRACVVAGGRELVASASLSYEPDRPEPGWAEKDPRVWWDAFRHIIGEITDQIPAGRLAGISLSSQSTTVIPLDKTFTPQRKAIIWQDNRCADQCERIREVFGEERVRQVTGWLPHTFLLWPKILWLLEHEPDLMDRTVWLAQINGFLTQRLCGQLVLDRSNSVGLPRNVKDLTWNSEFINWRDFPSQKIPPVVPSSTVVGSVSHESAQSCGLPPGLPVVAGGLDTVCAALAVGAFETGRSVEVSGTSGGIGVVSARPSDAGFLGVTAHVLPDLFLNIAPMSAGGASLTWCRDAFCRPEQKEGEERGVSAYEIMEEEVRALEDGPTGLLFAPYLEGERSPIWDSRTRGALLGLRPDMERASIIKGVMEGTGYALSHNVRLTEDAGMPIELLRSCGGGSRSEQWNQLKADIVGRAVVVFPPCRDAAFGAALLAGIGTNCWTLEDVEEGLDEEEPEIYVPRDEITELYQKHQVAFEQIYPHLKEFLRAPDKSSFERDG